MTKHSATTPFAVTGTPGGSMIHGNNNITSILTSLWEDHAVGGSGLVGDQDFLIPQLMNRIATFLCRASL